METGNPHMEDMNDVAEKSAEVDRLLAQAKKLSAELVATVNMLNSVVVVAKEPKDGD